MLEKDWPGPNLPLLLPVILWRAPMNPRPVGFDPAVSHIVTYSVPVVFLVLFLIRSMAMVTRLPLTSALTFPSISAEPAIDCDATSRNETPTIN